MYSASQCSGKRKKRGGSSDSGASSGAGSEAGTNGGKPKAFVGAWRKGLY